MTREPVNGIFCPCCGSPTELSDSWLTCSATRTEFSTSVASELHRYVETPPQAVPAVSFRWGGSWFCSADATAMVETDGRVSCLACGRTMPNMLLYSIIKFHVHGASTP